jgi:hypothetical protein
MRGGSKISMTVENVGTPIVYLSWYNSEDDRWQQIKNITNLEEYRGRTWVGAQWVCTDRNGKELSWVILADGDVSKLTRDGHPWQEIHVDLTPSKYSLTWTQPTPDAAPVGPTPGSQGQRSGPGPTGPELREAQKQLSRGQEEVRRAAASARTAPGHGPYTGPTDVGSAMDEKGY